MLTISNVSKSFGAVWAVNGVHISVEAGEIYTLIGPNGSGKTTLTKLIVGLLQPSQGSITVCGHDVVTEPVRAKAHVGYIPDNPEAWGRLTGCEFLHFTGALYAVPEPERAERIERLLPRFGLTHIQHAYFDQYSRGNRQKFTILAALLHQPDVLLIDEPIVGLDPDSVEILLALLREFVGRGGAVLLTTHSLSVAEAVAHRVGVLADGELHASGTLAELRAQAGIGDEAPLREIYRAVVPGPAPAPDALAD